MSEHSEDVLPEDPDGELVHWMQPKPLQAGPVVVTSAVAAAFVLGAVTAVGVLALMRWVGPERRFEPPHWPR